VIDSLLPAPDQLVGQTLEGRYRLEAVLATGGMGLLFRGTDQRTHRPVAVKLMKPYDGLDRSRVKLFLREVEIAARLRHPHIVDVLDLGTTQDGRAPYLVMELLDGCSLQIELDRRKRLPLDETLSLLLPIMDALGSVHDAGVVHRDIKPANIFLSRDAYGRLLPKLLDFGIAKALDHNIDLTSGAVFGTPAYMAPEQLRQATVGPAADVWAMGAVFYRCLNGTPPYVGKTAAEVITKIATSVPESLDVENVARGVCAAIDRALVREPDARYADMRRFARALVASARTAVVQVDWSPVSESSSLGGSEVQTVPQPGAPGAGITVERLGRRWGLAMAVVLTLGLALVTLSASGPEHGDTAHTGRTSVPENERPRPSPAPKAAPVAPPSRSVEPQAVREARAGDFHGEGRPRKSGPARARQPGAARGSNDKAGPAPSSFGADLPVAEEW
jgi:serine/threonine-protein kinase